MDADIMKEAKARNLFAKANSFAQKKNYKEAEQNYLQVQVKVSMR